MSDGGTDIEGVDIDFPPHPNPAALAAENIKFVVGYGGPGYGKFITSEEAKAYNAAGIAVVAVAEGDDKDPLGGEAVGVRFAREADAYFRSIGMPTDRPIYFAVDFDCTEAQWPVVNEFLQGAASVIGAARVGIYAGIRPIQWAHHDGAAFWFWQTYAWSGGQWDPRNNIEQYENGVVVGGVRCDRDRAKTNDYGQWTVGGRKGTNMFLLKVKNQDAIWISDGLRTRHIPGGFWENTCEPLMAAGVILIEYDTEEQVYLAGGPLDTTSGNSGNGQALGDIQIDVPATTLHGHVVIPK